ncbi:MAG: hypothetical protein KKA73_25385 [Chloroflexi bacterium]|nr:hypothetical protein [Chloroflexota bacterium]MBU1751030.1 hypothetical protein [Chloroflexota bacterium]MBU1879956.1 hypothetical protein [Chloroflexota bacterium]
MAGVSRQPAFTILDLGTTYVKALVVTTNGERNEVWGVGRQRLRGLRRGHLADVAAAAMCCETALCQAEDMTLRTCGVSLVPDQAIIGLSGAVLLTHIVPVRVARPQPDERVRLEELHALIDRGLRAAQGLAEQVGPVELVQAEPLRIAVDEHRVSDVTRFRGRELAVDLYSAFIPQTQLLALARLRQRLSLDTVRIAAGPLALAASRRADGLLIDLGGETTDLTLVSRGRPVAIHHVLCGGLAVDRELAQRLSVTTSRAETIKLSYAAGRLDEHGSQDVGTICREEAALWLASLQPVLRRVGEEQTLPPTIWLCGGGSQLPEVLPACQQFPWMQRLPFAQYPQVQRLTPLDLPIMVDRTGGQLTPQDVPALALARSLAQTDPTVEHLSRTLTMTGKP